jgi:RNA polymerase sigma-70 factor (ECF subfamily)
VRFFTVRLGSAAAAEDLVQDLYVKLSGLDPEVPVQNEAAFLYRLGSNLMLDRLRQQRRAAARDGDWRDSQTSVVHGQEVADEPSPEAAAAARQRLAVVMAYLNSLPPAQRQAFRMYKIEGSSQAEVAAALGCSVSSVEKYVRAAMKQLVDKLG